MPHSISSRSYLERAEQRLAEDRDYALFYAALELRCGIESRLQEYLDVWDHVSKKQKKGWSIMNRGRNVEKVFRVGNSVVRWAIHEQSTQQLIVCFYHTPVTKALRARGERLGNYLHALKRYHAPEDPWWVNLREELQAAVRELRTANTGTLLGPPLMKKGTGQVDMRLEIPPTFDHEVLMSTVMNRELIVEVSYLDVLPAEFEPQAVVWSRVS